MKKTAVEMTGHGRSGKPKAGFPTAPTALGNRQLRDSHIPTAATRRGKVENEKHVSHFPAHCFVFVSKTQKGDSAADRFAPAPGSFFDEKMLLWGRGRNLSDRLAVAGDGDLLTFLHLVQQGGNVRLRFGHGDAVGHVSPPARTMTIK